MTLTNIRLPYVQEWFTCEVCHETWAVAYKWQERCYNQKRVLAHLAEVEMSYLMHKTDHVLDSIRMRLREAGYE